MKCSIFFGMLTEQKEQGWIWVVPKIGVPQNGWFMMENPIKWVIWGYPYFWKHPYYGNMGNDISTTLNSLNIKKKKRN